MTLRPRPRHGVAAALAGGALLALGLAWRASPAIQPADGGEFQLVARELGVAHPPGYALYTLAAHAFGRLAVATPLGRLLGRPPDLPDAWPWAVNAFAAIAAGATLAVTWRLAARLAGGRPAGLLALVVLLASPTFLAQSGVANIRMPTALLYALLLHATVRWLGAVRPSGGPGARPSPRRGPDRRLVALALVYGLAAGHHGSLLVLGPVVAAVVIARRPAVATDFRTLAAAAGALLASLLPLAYLPWRDRAGAVLSEGRLQTAGGVLNHVLALDFRGDVLRVAGAADLWDRLRVLVDILAIQLGPLALALALLGALRLLRRRPYAAAAVLGTAGPIAALAATYRAPQTMEYLLPTTLALSVLAGVGGAWLAGALEHGAGGPAGDPERPGRPGARWPVAWLAIGVLAVLVAAPRRALPGRVEAARPDLDAVVDAALACAPAGGTILAAWHHATPLWYATRHRGAGPAPSVDYVFPRGTETPGETWLARLASLEAGAAGAAGASGAPAAARPPTVLTHRPRELIDAGVALWPVPGTPFFSTGPLACRPPGRLPAGLDPDDAHFGGVVRLASAALSSGPSDDPVLAAELHALTPVTETLTLVAQLADPGTGAVWGQVDRPVGPARWNDPRGVGVRLTATPFAGAPPGPLSVVLGLYRSGPGGPVRLPIAGRDAVVVGRAAPPPLRPADGIPFGRAMVLSGSRVRETAAGWVVDLTWRGGAAPAASDHTVSVQVHGDGWSAQHDGTPALGAIPTLKWLPGMTVHDRHRIARPAGVAAGAAATVTVGVYDAFSLETLPVLDADRVRAGEGQAVTIDG